MKKAIGKRVLGILVIGTGLMLTGTSSAWYADPWYRPYASGAMTYQRQNMMRHHGYGMQDLADMLDGRRVLNRDEAVRIAQELERGFGDELVSKYAPGAVVAGSRTVPWTWRHFGAFKGYAEAARQSSARLAEALEKAPGDQTFPRRRSWGPPLGPGYGRWGRPGGDAVPMAAIQEYTRLNATCHSCHMLFRGGRW